MTPQAEHKGIIPFPAWVVASILPACILLIGLKALADGRLGWSELLLILVGCGLGGGYVLLVGYVYGDAGRRGMNQALWTWVAILVPSSLGIILYFILREPLMVFCSHCGYSSKPSFAYCQICGSAISPTCPNCKKVVQSGWPHCAYCGTSLRPGRTNPSAPTTGGIPGTA
jgi:hypothetical protein